MVVSFFFFFAKTSMVVSSWRNFSTKLLLCVFFFFFCCQYLFIYGISLITESLNVVKGTQLSIPYIFLTPLVSFL